jgi:hypothetical protein
MRPKLHEIHMGNYDFTSLYPTVMKDIKIDKTKFRRKKIERLTKKINDKRTDQELPTE